eukprot:TRINITY_DN13573_c0_g1_i1.p1 TRINITY_DN13573_c0_g1~~TRINITY_DN13573_c0_g1_i1.p1  ORF type:complete len:113 (-),score=19.50 TRINITY_DN13573_c0_g1_i1:13-351(-)
MSLILKLENGKKKTFKLPKKKPANIGRSHSCTIPLDQDPHISRFHCRIVVEDNVPYLLDLGARHTRLNGTKITKAPLKPGDVIRIGKTELIFEVKGNIFFSSAPDQDKNKKA